MSTSSSTLCACGCGQPTELADRNRAGRGWVKGESKRFLHGHHNRLQRPSYTVDPETGCWNWGGHIGQNGYPSRITVAGGRRIAPYRFFYEEKHGLTSPDLQMDHLCKNRSCVNPDHVEPVTAAVNVRRRAATKLTAEIVEEIRKSRGTLSNSKAAAQFGLSRSTVSQIRTRNRWRAA